MTSTDRKYEAQIATRGKTIHIVEVEHLMATKGRGYSTTLCNHRMVSAAMVYASDVRNMDQGYRICRECFGNGAMPSNWGRELSEDMKANLTQGRTR